MPVQVIMPGNLGDEFDVGVEEANKIHVKLDATLQRNVGTGEIGADPAGLPDFWRAAVGGGAPDGVTDTTEDIYRSGHVGIGTNAPQTVLHIVADSSPNLVDDDIRLDVYNSVVNHFPNYMARRARGTLAAPLDVVALDAVMNFQGFGWIGGAFVAVANLAFRYRGISPARDAEMYVQLGSGAGAATRLVLDGPTGNLTLSGYPNTRNDAGLPSNVLFTTAAGLVQSKPLVEMMVAPVALADFAVDGALGTAAATVDIASVMILAQTTLGRTLTLPAPTNTQAGRLLYVTHNGAAAVVVGGISLAAGQTIMFLWDGNSWNPAVVPPEQDFWRGGVGGTVLPDGALDNVENIRREGWVGLAVDATSVLHVNGSMALAVRAVTAATTLTVTDAVIMASGGPAYLITLPVANTCMGRLYTIKNMGVAKTVSSYRNASGAASTAVPANGVLRLISDGPNWQQI